MTTKDPTIQVSRDLFQQMLNIIIVEQTRAAVIAAASGLLERPAPQLVKDKGDVHGQR